MQDTEPMNNIYVILKFIKTGDKFFTCSWVNLVDYNKILKYFIYTYPIS